jgi:hypothetical protein
MGICAGEFWRVGIELDLVFGAWSGRDDVVRTGNDDEVWTGSDVVGLGDEAGRRVGIVSRNSESYHD